MGNTVTHIHSQTLSASYIATLTAFPHILPINTTLTNINYHSGTTTRKRVTRCKSQRNITPSPENAIVYNSSCIILSVHQCFLTSLPLCRRPAPNCSPTPRLNHIVRKKGGLFPDVRGTAVCLLLCSARLACTGRLRFKSLDSCYSRGETV